MNRNKVHICKCGRKSINYKECTYCRNKKYAKNTADRKNKEAGQENNDDLVKFFDYHVSNMIKIKATCEECGCLITNPTKWNVAHIVPKEHFQSVRSFIENRMYLCRLHHGKFDMSFEDAMKMKVWPLAIQRFNLFSHLIKEKHKYLNFYKQ